MASLMGQMFPKNDKKTVFDFLEMRLSSLLLVLWKNVKEVKVVHKCIMNNTM